MTLAQAVEYAEVAWAEDRAAVQGRIKAWGAAGQLGVGNGSIEREQLDRLLSGGIEPEEKVTPFFGSYECARNWMMERCKTLGIEPSAYKETSEYQALHDQLLSLRAMHGARSDGHRAELLAGARTQEGDRVELTVGERSVTGRLVRAGERLFVELEKPVAVTQRLAGSNMIGTVSQAWLPWHGAWRSLDRLEQVAELRATTPPAPAASEGAGAEQRQRGLIADQSAVVAGYQSYADLVIDPGVADACTVDEHESHGVGVRAGRFGL